MKKIKIGIFHGINVDDDFKYKNLSEDALSDIGIIADVVELRWPSTGTIFKDVTGLMFSDGYRNDCIATAKENLLREMTRHDFDLLIGHSMGAVMLLKSLEMLDNLGVSIPSMMIGNPLSHPIWGSGLRAAGLGLKPERCKNIPSLWNKDDIVTSLYGWQTNPEGFDMTRIAIVGQERNEHPMELYLSHPLFKIEIMELLK